MNFLELVSKRFSLRKYSSKKVDRELIEKCLEAARLAPSACNSQPWYFIVVDVEESKNKLADIAFSGVYSSNSFAKKAPVLVVVINEKSNYVAKVGGFLRGTQYSLIDIGIAVEHFVLQAQELGIGTCWLGWFNEKGVKKFLGIPKSKKVEAIISMGYPPEGTTPREKKRKSLDEIREYFAGER